MYDGSISKWGVRPGQIWKINSHTLYCDNFLSVPFSPHQFDYCYTDPPWNQKILNDFWKYASLTPPAPDIDILLFQILEKLQSIVYNSIVVEMGKKKALIVAEFLNPTSVMERTYPGGSLFVLAKNYLKPLSPLSGMAGAKATIFTFPSNSQFIEPCAGEGHFVEMAIQNKMICTATEIIPEKFASMLSRLSKYGSPERIFNG